MCFVRQFLTGFLDSIESAGAPTTAAASHKSNNAWFKAFDLVYGGVASDYSIPTGKNRYHKFKDKVVEVWIALEQQAPADHPCRPKGLQQLEDYRKACAEANKPTMSAGAAQIASSRMSLGGESVSLAPSPGGGATPVGKGRSSLLPPKTPGTGIGKRAMAMAGGAGSHSIMGSGTGGGAMNLWRNLDETKTLGKLPQPLQNLLHLRQLGREMMATTTKAARKALDENNQKLEAAYQEELSEYLAASSSDGKKKSAKDNAYDRSMCLALLHRYALTVLEQKTITEAYQKAVEEYVEQVAAVEPPSAGATNTTSV